MDERTTRLDAAVIEIEKMLDDHARMHNYTTPEGLVIRTALVDVSWEWSGSDARLVVRCEGEWFAANPERARRFNDFAWAWIEADPKVKALFAHHAWEASQVGEAMSAPTSVTLSNDDFALRMRGKRKHA